MQHTPEKPHQHAADDSQVRSLYHELLQGWNRSSARDFAALFTGDGNTVGFDGSQMNGRTQIETELAGIFASHQTARFIGIIRDVRFLDPTVAVIRAVAGMVPPGQTEINAATNAIQTLIAVKQDGGWRIALFQNTPAAFHGRPELAQQLTAELQQAV